MRNIIVHFENGETMPTSINGTNKEILAHYIGQSFDFGDTEEHPESKMVKAVKVDFELVTRKQRLAGEISHDDYYNQFVSESMIRHVVSRIGFKKIMKSKDEHMNDIPMGKWDMIKPMNLLKDRDDWKKASLSTYSKEEQEKNSFIYSMSDETCLAKAAARIYKTRNC